MLRITKQTDYAILLLTYMAAQDPNQVHTSRSLAEWSHLSLPMVSKILKPLSREGIIISTRGVKGGYTLARLAEEITVGEIIRATEGPIGMTSCITEPGSCEQESFCPVKVNWERISHAVWDAVDDVPLSEMIGPAERSEPHLLAIR
jgi:FeS assembly SUF system regulator